MAKETAPVAAIKKTYGDLEVVVLKSRCIGASVCVYEARGSFVLDQQRKALVSDLSKNKEATIVAAARNCPTQAIFIYKNKKQIWPPPGKTGVALQPGADVKMSFE